MNEEYDWERARDAFIAQQRAQESGFHRARTDEALTEDEQAAFLGDLFDDPKYGVNAQYVRSYTWKNPSES